ncbi:hypothetical protein AVEN_235459-1 [Araneus ventricosus]|uniref:Uncharacterized protein n=1 Tax=Araneus ventricosus TaxID=182803 RepID=A0A4Y2A6I0_ARAVE|nr:hypothetical protein AVEN_235459-1 [Araneus ventricosus]
MAKKLQGSFEMRHANMPDEFPDDSGSEDSEEEKGKTPKVPQEQLEEVTKQISILTTETKKKVKNKKKSIKRKERDESKEIGVDYLSASEPSKRTAPPAAQPNETRATDKTHADEVLNANDKTPNQNTETYYK